MSERARVFQSMQRADDVSEGIRKIRFLVVQKVRILRGTVENKLNLQFTQYT